MPLAPGTHLGPYEILAPLGAGGMGEVYRARDPKLNRDVALKILPALFADDPDRMTRFQREAQILASLNHPNIAAIYGLEESQGVRALVMELVEGPTLADRIAVGAIANDEALPIARQVAEALEYAHDRGVIHRDLKPANIKVTPQGQVKVLDFGLAKALDDEAAVAQSQNSPTLTLGATRAGVILGTAAYMAPEQAKGKAADRRADIWAFGVVLYEMFTGRQLFDGETAAETLASVMKEVLSFDALPSTTPPAIRRLIARCLERDVRRRLQAIGEARIILEGPLVEEAPGLPQPAASARPTRLPWILAAASVLAALVLAFLYFRQTAPALHVLRYTVAAPENSQVHSFAISPDGRMVVIAALVNGKSQLWLRPLDALQAQPIPFTDDATYPFWSPDSRYIGFFAQGKLKKVAASGGPSQSLCDVPGARGGSWSRDDVIVFSPGPTGLAIQRVSAAGGVPSDVNPVKGSYKHPVFLPDGRHFLYLVSGLSPEKNGIYVSSLDGKENRRVLADVSAPVFAPASGNGPGHLLFIRENTLMAQPFDAARAQIAGDVFPVADGVSLTTNGSWAPAAVSDDGVLLYGSGGAVRGNNQLAWFDRSGKPLGPVGMPGDIWDPALSPDEKSVVFRRGPSATSADLWLRDLTRGTEQRLTTDPSTNYAPFWSPQGDRIVFGSNRGGTGNLYQKAATGSAQDELLLKTANLKAPTQWSKDGRFVVFMEVDPKSHQDLWVIPVGTGNGKPVAFLQTEFNEIFGQLSPDSHWMAYTSDKSGRREVYVRPFPPADGEWPISVAGGEAPRWRADGKELFFEAADGKMMAVPVKAAAAPKPLFEAGTPVALFDPHIAHYSGDVIFEYDVTADGKRFLINTTGAAATAAAPLLTVVVNWNAGAKK